MQVAEEADETSILVTAQQYGRDVRLGIPAWRTDRIAVFIAGREIAPVQLEMFIVFPGKHRIWLSSRRNQNSAGRQYGLPGFLP